MASILQPISDVLTKLATLQVTNGDGQTVSLYTRIWNDQVKNEGAGKLYNYPKPAAFVEVIDKAEYKEIGCGFRACDIGWKIHLIHEYYNDVNDITFEQDLAIFALKDAVVELLALYQPTACGPMVCIAESQEYDHTNVYHWILDFICHFIDSKGSWYDPVAGKYIYTTPPIELLIVPEETIGGNLLIAEDGENILQESGELIETE